MPASPTSCATSSTWPSCRPAKPSISDAFDDWVRRHPQLTATQLMFVRTLRKAVMQRPRSASLDALRKPPFSAIGDPETLFERPELTELFDLIEAVAA